MVVATDTFRHGHALSTAVAWRDVVCRQCDLALTRGSAPTCLGRHGGVCGLSLIRSGSDTRPALIRSGADMVWC